MASHVAIVDKVGADRSNVPGTIAEALKMGPGHLIWCARCLGNEHVGPWVTALERAARLERFVENHRRCV